VKTTAISRFIAIASIVKSGCVSVIADGQNFSKVGAGDDGTDCEAIAGRSLS
jgi:hypothetical protein